MIRTCIVELATGTVINIVAYDTPVIGTPPGYDDGGYLTPARYLAVASDTAQIGWTWTEEGGLVNPAPPSPIPRADQIAARRWAAEVGGTTWSGWPVGTDRDSQAKVNAAYTLARDGYWPEGAGWKFGDGVYRALSPEDVVAMALAVSAHVQSCYAHEAALLADLDADIDDGWPAGSGQAESGE